MNKLVRTTSVDTAPVFTVVFSEEHDCSLIELLFLYTLACCYLKNEGVVHGGRDRQLPSSLALAGAS